MKNKQISPFFKATLKSTKYSAAKTKERYLKNELKKLLYIATISTIILATLFFSTVKTINEENQYKEIKFSTLTYQLEKENVKEINVDKNKMIIKAELRDGRKVKTSYYSEDYLVLAEKYTMPQSANKKLKVNIKESTDYYKILASFTSIVFYLMIFWLLYSTMGKNQTREASSAKGEKSKVTFADVAGMDEEKQELEEIVDFLKKPEKYTKIGARIPKGVLLVGKPGCGKTYISKAVAGEAGVPFFSCSGSEFVEMFVGLGASRVRSLFKKARKSAPCIIFIDEIDAIGRVRGNSTAGADTEQEGTLNQILVEMDGFNENEGIIILAATNRPDILDPALMRAGRFDRQVVINLPDVKGRDEVFKQYCKDKKLSNDINTEILAKRTPGFAPADIENLMNEAAILAVRHNKSEIDMDIIEKAITKIIAGPEKNRVISEKERKLTAIHESGHAICSRYLETVDPVHQITIIPHGYGAGGFTMTLPKEDRMYATKQSMTEEIIDLLGGRAAESIKLEDISTGASNDIQRATQIARDMMTKYGFSETLGNVNYDESEDTFLGRNGFKQLTISSEIQATIDSEVKTLIDTCFERAKEIILTHIQELDAVSETLLEKETLSGEEFTKICDDIVKTSSAEDDAMKRFIERRIL